MFVYGSVSPEEVVGNQDRYGRKRAGAMMEYALGRIAQGLVAAGRRRVVVAGGETAGAVDSTLGVTARRIDPGVQRTQSLVEPPLALVLKSGNVGTPDSFEEPLGMLT